LSKVQAHGLPWAFSSREGAKARRRQRQMQMQMQMQGRMAACLAAARQFTPPFFAQAESTDQTVGQSDLPDPSATEPTDNSFVFVLDLVPTLFFTAD